MNKLGSIKQIASFFMVLGLAACTSQSEVVTSQSDERVVDIVDPVHRAPVSEITPANTATVKPPVYVTPAQPVIVPVTKPAESAIQADYTIQLAAISHEDGFAAFMEQLPHHYPMFSNEKEVNGKPWYALLYGEFTTKQQAQAALENLPESFREQGAFIRSIAKIKQSSSPVLRRLNQ